MSPLRPSPFRSLALAAALVTAPAVASASSIDDSAARVVVPLVLAEKGAASSVFVTNDETRPVKVQVRYVGERYSPAAGYRVCGSIVLPAATQVTLDVGQVCQLPADPGAGMVVLIETDAEVARISARARIDTLSKSGDVLGTVPVLGLPVGAVDTTENVHVVQGLRWQGAGTVGNTTDCFFGSLFDGSGGGGMAGFLTLKDAFGQDLGSVLFNLRPFELFALRDVFKLAGVSGGPYAGVRAEVVWTGKGDAVLGYCLSNRDGAVKGERTVSFEPAQVAEPNDEVRKRAMVASGTPSIGAFTLRPALPTTDPRNSHGLYVRHPDRVNCSVVSSDPHRPMFIKAISPDGTQQIGGTAPTTTEFGNSPRGSLAGGVADLWGLEVSWPPGTFTGYPTKYRIECRSGNGTSLADFLF
ncbi:MAG: hypothetical protein ABW221_22560 [Vicinamibacteria bacterium]